MGKTLMGGVSHQQNVDLLTPEQQNFLTSAMGGLQQMGQPTDPQQFQQMFQESFVDPATQMLQRQVIPALKEAYLGEETGSSALNQALAQSATDISTNLGQQLMNQYNIGQQRQMGALGGLGGLAGQRTFQPMLQQQKGLAGPLIGLLGQLGGAYLGGPLGATLGGTAGQAAGEWAFPEQSIVDTYSPGTAAGPYGIEGNIYNPYTGYMG